MTPHRRSIRSSRRGLLALAAAALAVMATGLAHAAPQSKASGNEPPTAAASDAEDRGWPREFEAEGHLVRIYQPQLEEWPNFGRILFRAAISVIAKGGGSPVHGIIRCSGDTDIAVDDRIVILTNRKIESIAFADLAPAESARMEAIVRAAMPPERPQTISLDRLMAELGSRPADMRVEVRKADVGLAPPKIIASETPAILVTFMGKPRFAPVQGCELLVAVNTNWDLFLDPDSKRYYLLNEGAWLTAADVERGPWSAAARLPAAFAKLPADANWADVRAAIPGAAAGAVPLVYVAREPTELIVTRGAPALEAIDGTNLSLVTNTENTLLYHRGEKQYYLLVAGRWFRAGALAGPWSSASRDLPPDFQRIPEDSAAGDVLASVPGTVQSSEAAILASIPRKATIVRADVSLTVTYNGPPDFRPIDGTTVKYAHNTPFNVFLVEGKYYCCNDAVWFVAAAPNGPWAVCDAVPKAIYTIPASSPKHNVTYVTVYDSTPTTVVTGYTAGYSGATVATTGVVMFGLGVLVGVALDDDDDCCWSYHYRAHYFSYGCGAIYVGGRGGYVCGVGHCGPYGGAGRWATYNPSTGIYSRGAFAYGPNGAAGYRVAYDPSNGLAGFRAGGSNIYGSWGRGAITNGDEWVRGGYRAGERGTVGGVQGSGGAGAIHAEGRFGNGVTVVRDRDGDMYAGKDGKVYRRSDDEWSRDRPPAKAGDLPREAAERDRGERNAKRTSDVKRDGGNPRRRR